MAIKNTTDLRNVLLDTIEKVKSKKIDPTEANAISKLSACVIKSSELDLAVQKYADMGMPKNNKKDIGSAKLIA